MYWVPESTHDPPDEPAGHAEHRCPAQTTPLRRDPPARQLVAEAAARLPGPVRLRRLLHMGRPAERALHVRAVPLPDVLAGAVGRLAACMVRPQAVLVSGLAALLAR